ncbi:gdsl esterase/lipase, partial [Quercus suber]
MAYTYTTPWLLVVTELLILVSITESKVPAIIFFNYNKYEIRCGLAGFDAVGVACCSTGTFEMSYLCSEHNPLTCSDANKYVFWDAFHPTEKTNHIIFQTSSTNFVYQMAYICMYIKWFLLTQFLLTLVARTGAKVPAIIVFGDSSVDAGNNNQIPTIARSNFGPYGRDFSGRKATGRFSNGRIATDFVSEAFGLKPTIPAYLDPAYNISDFATGVTFASAGTGYDNATSNVLSVIPLWKELVYYEDYQKRLRAYLGETKANQVISDALYMISMGTNDFLENYYTFPAGRQSRFTVTQYEDFLIGIAGNFIKELYSLGARKISLGGLPPMGCLPLERATNIAGGNQCVERYNTVALEFNGKLKMLTTTLNKDLSGLKLVFSNPYYIFTYVIRKPATFGFDVTSVGCCATGMFEMGYACNQNNLMTCTDADKYSVIPLWKELVYYEDYQKRLRAYLGETKANQVISDALYMISMGTNDFLENYYTFPAGRQSRFTVTQYEDFLIGIAGNFIKELYSLGARKISLGGLPPMGCLPLERATNIAGGNQCVERYNTVALEFNGKLKMLTTTLNKDLSGLKLVFSNPYYIFTYVIRKPATFGFDVTSVGCCATGMFEMGYACNQNNLMTCTDADKY